MISLKKEKRYRKTQAIDQIKPCQANVPFLYTP